MTEQILSYFVFNEIEIIALSVLFVFLLIQIFFYVAYYNKPYSYVKRRIKDNYVPVASSRPKVSVIISSENEVTGLSENLPAILAQDYPDFEVIVVNNGSTDESDELLQSLKLNNPHLYHTYLPYSNDKTFGRRKLAFTIGIKAAKGDVLLFTEPYSRPVSSGWITSMINELSEDKDIVLGYSFYHKKQKFFNLIARFDNLLFSMQYLSMAIKGKPFTGIYRNIAFRKHLFFDNKGFASHLGLENGEDVFINQIITPDNTAVALIQDSFVETYIERFSLWKQIKKSYSVAKAYFRSHASALFGFEVFSRYFFYLLLAALVTYSIMIQNWAILGISVFMFLIRLIIQLTLINKSSKYFNSGKFYFSLILMDILQPVYNARFRTRHKSRI
jgi:glycosyltransferase involved in cell wall biosynthesis